MHKFKFEPPEQRRSHQAQPPRQENIQIINQLDKCTQILREDRIWLRNEIKNQNEDVLQIFRLFSKSSQLQYLQIKLRKYLQAVKNRVKMEQLNKFKENLYNGSTHSTNSEYNTKKTHTQYVTYDKQLKETSVQKNRSSTKSSFKKYQKPQLGRPSNKSQQHFDHQPKFQIPKKIKNFEQAIQRNKYAPEIIEERESENVTSARQGRRQKEHNYNYRIDRYNQEPFQGRFNNNFVNQPQNEEEQQFEEVQQHYEGFKEQYNEGYKEPHTDQGREIVERFKNSKWSFEHVAQKELYKNKASLQQEKHVQFSKEVTIQIPHKQSPPIQEQQKSIFHQHFISELHGKSNQYLFDDPSKSNIKISQISAHPLNDTCQLDTYNLTKMIESQSYCPEEKKNQEKVVEKKDEKKQNVVKQYQNLFTPIQLLNQCRAFLKNRQNSSKKPQEQIKFQPYKPSKHTNSIFEFSKQQKPQLKYLQSNSKPPSQCLYSRNNENQEPLFRDTDQNSTNKKKKDQSYNFPQIQSSSKKHSAHKIQIPKPQKSNQKNKDVYHFNYFDTFANQQSTNQISQKKKQVQKEDQIIVNIDTHFNIEKFMEKLLQENEYCTHVKNRKLKKFIENYNYAFTDALQEQLQNEQICVSDIALTLQNYYEEKNGQKYQIQENQIEGIYSLLDIEKKGFIVNHDIEEFLSQLRDAELENYQQVESWLWRLFESADFKEQSKITIWNLLMIKNTEEFESVCGLLGQFEFEIEGQQ